MSSDPRLEQLQRDLARLRSPTKPAKGRDGGRGREADHPGEIPPRGWKDILWRAWGEVSEQNLFLIAGGVTYAILLALFPGLAALVSLYGLVFDAGQIERQVAALSGVLPAQTQELLSQELHSLVQTSGGALGFAAIAGLLLALWSASRGMSGLITAINIAYEEKETSRLPQTQPDSHRPHSGTTGRRHRCHRARCGPASRRAAARRRCLPRNGCCCSCNGPC